MFQVLSSSWALLLGMMLLLLGNGMQGTLLGIRGEAEGFTTLHLSIIMSGYFIGFLGGSKVTPRLIRRVGHVRVFAALGSLISAVLIMYPVMVDPYSWTAGRIVLGFCFSGVYVTAESWLNNAATNETRGKSLSLYLIVQMIGIIAAQALINIPDASGFLLFIIPSVLVSLAFAPILLSISPTPAFATAQPMSLRRLYNESPLGTVGIFLLGLLFAAQFGMGSVFAAQIGMNVAQISTFVATFYIGALLFQYPIGWISDRMDRRQLVIFVGLIGAGGGALGFVVGSYEMLLVAAFFVGGMSNPLYGLLVAHVNDHLKEEDMASAAGGMVFVNGLGAIAGPLITGWMMSVLGPNGFFLYLAILCGAIAAYAAYRMTQREAVAVEDTGAWTPVYGTTTPVAMEAVQEIAIEAAQESSEDDGEDAKSQ